MKFINLTNGIEYLPEIGPIDGFVRIQSTACEQKRWWRIIRDLDYTFLLAVASGIAVTVYDTSQKKNVPRALYQGIEWIRYALSRRWLDSEVIPIVRGCNCQAYFRECYDRFSEERSRGLQKLDYVGKLTAPNALNLQIVSKPTHLDGRYDIYREILVRESRTLDEREQPPESFATKDSFCCATPHVSFL